MNDLRFLKSKIKRALGVIEKFEPVKDYESLKEYLTHQLTCDEIDEKEIREKCRKLYIEHPNNAGLLSIFDQTKEEK